MSQRDHRTVKRRPSFLRALGDHDPPEQVSVGGTAYRRTDILKHDSWAATAIYCSAAKERIICKFNRTASALGLPLAWVGRTLAARESRFLKILADVELIPNDLGPVTSGERHLPNAVARVYVEGEPLRVKEQLTARLFDELRALLRIMHARNLAYVDLHKLENIIVDREGRPHLIDFQASFGLSDSWPGNGALARFWLHQLQEMDVYHVNKHLVRSLPETLTPAELETYSAIPRFIRMHRAIAVPLRALRRKLLVVLRVRDVSGSASSELEPEDAYRRTPPVRQQ